MEDQLLDIVKERGIVRIIIEMKNDLDFLDKIENINEEISIMKCTENNRRLNYYERIKDIENELEYIKCKIRRIISSAGKDFLQNYVLYEDIREYDAQHANLFNEKRRLGEIEWKYYISESAYNRMTMKKIRELPEYNNRSEQCKELLDRLTNL